MGHGRDGVHHGKKHARQLRINKNELVKVTQRLVATNGERIPIYGAIFLNLRHGNKKTTLMVYVAAQASRTLLYHTACGELDLVTKDFYLHEKITGHTEEGKILADTEVMYDTRTGSAMITIMIGMREITTSKKAVGKDIDPETPAGEATTSKTITTTIKTTITENKITVPPTRTAKLRQKESGSDYDPSQPMIQDYAAPQATYCSLHTRAPAYLRVAPPMTSRPKREPTYVQTRESTTE